MVYAILSDLHANESALRHVLADARANGAERVVCLGDIVGYGPLPRETLALIRREAALVLAGNHDDAVTGRIDASSFIDLAGDAVRRHRDALSSADLAWLGSLPYTGAIEGACATHGDLTSPQDFCYVESEDDARANFEATDAQLVFVGHTHVPALFVTGQSGAVYAVAPQDFTLEDGKRYIVNPGSVGYPRESHGECHSSYVLYDSCARTVTFRFLPFSVASVLQRGTGPGRLRRRLIFLGLLLTAAVGIAAYLLAPRTQVVNRIAVTQVSADEDPAKIVSRQTLAIAPADRKVCANLRLDQQSAPVQLCISFIDATNRVLIAYRDLVKRSSAKKYAVPDGATAARFILLKTGAAQPAVRQFSPSAQP